MKSRFDKLFTLALMRLIIALSTLCAIASLALALYCATRIPLLKHSTETAVEQLSQKYMDRSRLKTLELADVDRHFALILSNDKARHRAWSELWPLAPFGFLAISLANFAIAVASYRSRPRASQTLTIP
ncbi:hypothetical protein [Paucibacter sp. M5-1]|uniref:hypothetical protein n=1 Tax=Paucibacter sp. M5-1 TaxID=3015998 RepID=UPI0022B85CF7|nr:hypothetical protein [Paucibacter sp. M5-1]MCZ7880356.1 hypothetical protein [Paucibacter sp. M5-1]